MKHITHNGLHLLLPALVLFTFLFGQIAEAADFAVIVNAGNDYQAAETEMKTTVKRLFLKEAGSWPNNIDAEPIDRAQGSAEQQAFMSQVLNLDAAALARHWMAVKQKTGQTAPREVSAGSIVLKLIGSKKGAFAVVDTASLGGLPGNARILFQFSAP
ncbi:MAG: hypothetical protein CVV13_11590 [Gammaproteobacteria bacterium HGW-Gammaproteobacteria-3]|nr:MAG: hypothetical protein CVV13_11590 [Gammaproteobacteria bacterium HGW-Gammaproteobacteria-3]